MSQENMETIRRCDAAISRGDVDSYLFGVHPDVEFIPRRAAVQGTYNGHAGIGRESGVEVTHPTALLVAFQDGKIICVEDFGERGAALEAAGLSE
jgi:ketosteroid isomerase-like protein